MNNSQTSINLQEVTNLRNRLLDMSNDIDARINTAIGSLDTLRNNNFIDGQVAYQLVEAKEKIKLAAASLKESIQNINTSISEAQTQFEDLDVQFAGTIEKLGNVDPTKYSAGGINE